MMTRSDVQRGRAVVETAHRGHGAASPAEAGAATGADALRQITRRRRARDTCFPAGLFADPAWDILLHLAIAHIERQEMSVTDVCAVAGVPQTTALRWIAALWREGLVDRIPDRRDSRRVIVRLGAEGWSRMERYLRTTGIADVSRA